ncbi:MAG: lysostaphin resistance A-like protein [Candidatus Methylomirabilales bacterium]
MRFSGRLTCVLLGILALSVIVAPLTKVAVDWLLANTPSTAHLPGIRRYPDGSYDFGRVFRRLLLLSTLLCGYLARRWLGPISLRGIGTGSSRGRHLGSGLVLGGLSFSLFLGSLILLGERSLAPEAPANWPLHVGGALASGLLVGVIEETIFRGFLLGGLLRDQSPFAAVLLSSSLFSAVHFLRAKAPVTVGLDLSVGVRGLLAHFRPLVQPPTFFPFIGLLLVGIVLAYAYLWSNSLPFAIGLHAGWVFAGKTGGLLLRERTGIMWLYGPHGVLAGALGWAFLLLMLFLLRLWIAHTSTPDPR